MVSALFLTTCSTSAGSAFGMARMASMSLISARPMMSSVVLCVTVIASGSCDAVDVSGSDGCLEARQDEGGDERACRRLVAEVDVVGWREEVADDQAGHQLDEAGALPPREVLVDQRHEEHGGDADDPRQAVDGEGGERLARLGGQHDGEVVVDAQLVRG